MNRRSFIGKSAMASMSGITILNSFKTFAQKKKNYNKPLVISTWNHGIAANAAAWEILSTGGKALDAVEQGVMVVESDPKNRSVGIGGRPDREGNVTLDACIQDEKGNCGAVAYLQNIKNPIAVARMVMEKTPHVMLAGDGALDFALSQGFKKENLLTPESENEWRKWMSDTGYKLPINVENHDTIGMVAIDASGNLSGSCTTSGAAWKMKGRIGDSPIIGAGLFVDNMVGGACATGQGELVIKIAGSHLVVEMMRLGKSPEEACKIAVERMIEKHPNHEGLQVGFLAVNKYGEHGGFSLRAGFDYALYDLQGNRMVKANYFFNW